MYKRQTQGFFPEAQKIFKEHGQFQHDFEKVSEEYTLDEVVMPGNQFDMEVLGAYDVIISRGITAELFRRQAEQPPVVEIPLAGNDLVRTMMQARRTYGDKVFALVGSHTVVYGAEDLARILDIRMRCYERHSDQDWTATVDRAIDDGCQVLLGGVQTSQYAVSYTHLQKGLQPGLVIDKTNVIGTVGPGDKAIISGGEATAVALPRIVHKRKGIPGACRIRVGLWRRRAAAGEKGKRQNAADKQGKRFF